MAEIQTPTSGYSTPSGSRPLGVTILALLQIIGGMLSLLTGAYIFSFPFFGWIVGVVVVLLALLDLIIGWGLWAMKSWAWMAAIILNIISLIMAIPTFDYLSIIISLIIILYLQQADIKSRFR
ncbi:MAG: hypothetical protein OEV85_14185 [Candidatus Thorarchaeota archaeon]|nr:hypothetical protein [Candidatus Thorarchaeota archaeon]